MHHRAKDYTGRTFGYLTALRYAGSNGRRSLWTFQCQCGAHVDRPIGDVEKHAKRGGSPSCGCFLGTREKLKTHGMTDHPAFAVWRSMHDRCRLPSHHAWKNYGGRGITVCERWASFENFWQDMGPTYKSGLTLDRVKNDLGYSPQNCRWADRKTQAMNRRGSLPVDLAALSELSGIPLSTLRYRWGRGQSMTSSTPDLERASWFADETGP